MFLRSVVLRGFKSFADKTVLEFGSGVSVIVGPNGSGKSNLADAISWVLGEQGPRALRGSQMADVIFAGGKGRPALGMAQVGLIIDNTTGLIPVPASEIEVARTIFRSGESEYSIAGQTCRLMDIQELLSDTGIGRGLHTVIGQGHLEDVLVARPEERRRFIEEAAGIAKHRRRKERAQRKLVSLEQDLLRLQDVMAELKRQLKPLRQQAEVAQRHEALASEAAELSWRMAAARLRELYADRDRRRPGWEEGLTRRRDAEARLAALDAEIAGHRERLTVAERELESAEREHAESLRARSEAETALREAVGAEGDARARVAADQGRAGRLFTLEEELRRTEVALGEAVDALADRERALAGAEREFQEALGARRRAEEALHRAREASHVRRAELESHRRMLVSSETERERLASALADVRGREEKARAERARLEAEVERLDAEEMPIADRQAKLQHESERLSAELAHLQDAERRLEARRHALEARRAALTETPGSRFVRRSRGLGLLGKLVQVEHEMEKALAAALGPLADAIVYERHGQAVADAGAAAGATLIAAEEGGAGFHLPGERSLASFVRPDSRLGPLVGRLLGNVYLATDPEEALAKHRRHPAASFVTREGILVGPAQVRTAPTPTEDELAVRREDVAVSRDLARVRSQLAGKRGRRAQLDGELRKAEEELNRTDALITAAAEGMARLGADLAALEREREIVEHRLERVEESVCASREAMAALPAESEASEALPPHPEPPLTLRVEVEALRRERARLEAGLARCRGELEQARAADPARLQEEVEQAARARERAEATLREEEQRAAAAAGRRESALREASEARAAEAGSNEAWREAAAALQRLRDEYEDQDQVRRDLERRIAEAERVLVEGHERDPAGAVESLREDDTPEALRRRSDVVARRLTLLGRVNLVAGEEYRTLQERHDFLKREIEDVYTARRDLQRVVREVDRKIVEIFEAAAADVASQFSSVVEILFPGGEGSLHLTDPDDLMDTGVEIEVRPGSKRVKRLSLLSGGERSLVALGFLFAIFRARPSPFYLLDEVEAALDDVNLHRFLELIKDFAKTSQVILITHQKRTMEAADVLYGISMASGVSTVISQRLAPASEAPPLSEASARR